ncbi:unnamed protein product [Oppiella nova]|uniref:Uncharacterized protein n=1 Tax=Oppiella nova TaxID=334625 RepID=A0A7R9LUL2_9ACAR|nr:unnamed protein product [Oppiella nova]CAG2167127.1 unnamed protein product [Oppiella nova]
MTSLNAISREVYETTNTLFLCLSAAVSRPQRLSLRLPAPTPPATPTPVSDRQMAPKNGDKSKIKTEGLFARIEGHLPGDQSDAEFQTPPTLLILYKSRETFAQKTPKMETLLKVSLFLCIVCAFSAFAAPANKKVDKQTATTTGTTPAANATTDKAPTIDWGKCPQLEPKDAEKRAKAAVLETCLARHPIPANLTQETIESHQKAIAECALRTEKWFTAKGNYRYSKAENEIKAKKLPKDVESALLAHHKNCESEAKREFASKERVIDQIQLYQACMDYHITSACGIQLKDN